MKLRVIELFAGIGSQHKALKNIGVDCEVVGISEWSIDSIISYANVHHNSNEVTELTKEEILEELKDFTFSSNTKTPIKTSTLKLDRLKKLYVANKNSKNLGSIVDLKASMTPDHDLLTYSFPCQDLSNQGSQRGLFEGKSSSLLWDVNRLLNELNEEGRLPKYLLMENVPAIFGDKNKDGFNIWKDNLKEMGYINFDFKLKASYFGIPQNRERAYMVSILNGTENDFVIPTQGELTEMTIADILTPNQVSKYYLDFKRFYPPVIKTDKTKNGISCFDLVGYTNFASERKVYHLNSISPTITATGAQSRIKVYENGEIRMLSPRECWKMMGFTDSDFDKVEGTLIDSALTKQAGNSIVVNVLEAIFTNLFIKKPLN
jgi:DNA (cytosine-5)-methyltransferase 1